MKRRWHHQFWFALSALTLLLARLSIHADDEPEKKAFFLPKSPAAAAYVLGRLSNKELIAAPRSEFVYVALLSRPGLACKYRIEAVQGLVEARHSDPVAELVRGLSELDAKGDTGQAVIAELGSILLQTGKSGAVASATGSPDAVCALPNSSAAALASKRTDLEKLSAEAQLPLTREIGFAAQMTADGSWEKVLSSLESESGKLAEAIRGLALVRDSALRASAYSKIESWIQKSDPAEVRLAAISTVPSLPTHETAAFSLLSDLAQTDAIRTPVLLSLARLPRTAWDKSRAQTLIDSAAACLKTIPLEERTEADAVTIFQFATDLASLLPAEQAATARKLLRALGVSVVVVHTIPEQMLYDKSLIVAEAGKPLEIILVNEDAMPHNMVILAPKAAEEIGPLTEKLTPEADSEGRLYIPNSPKVLFATKLVEPRQQIKLSFTAPSAPGDYEYFCSFPGHWRRMRGILAVVTDVEAYLSSHAAQPQPTMIEWKIEDFKDTISKVGTAQNLAEGRDQFTKLGCAQCHKLGTDGANYGPDLSDVFARYKNDPTDVLRQIIEPSLVISNRFINYEFELRSGDTMTGLIVKEDADSLTIQTGPSDALIQNVKKTEIKSREAQKSSPMPMGLLNSLSKDQIVNLLSYLQSGGKSPVP